MFPMRIRRETIETPDGIRLFFQKAEPSFAHDDADCRIKGTVVITHGMGEHSSRYGHVVERFIDAGWQVVTYDLRGHGRSTGRRGYAPAFESFLDDLALILQTTLAPEERIDRPVFLYGHSMGGLISTRFLEEGRGDAVPIRGAIISSPLFRLAFDPPWWKLALGMIMRHIWPTFSQKTGSTRTRLSRDLPFLAAMPDLHLSHAWITARLFYEIQQASRQALANASKVTCPLLLMHGQADPVTCWTSTRDFYAVASSTDKTLRLYPETLHELHNDVEREAVLDTVLAWMEERRGGE